MTTCGTGSWSGPLPGDPDSFSILSAAPAFGGIDVTWTMPLTNPFAVAHTLIYRSTSNLFSTAVKIATVAGDFYYDKLDVGVTYYYWIKFVSINGTVGDLIGPASATARPLIHDMIDILEGQITSSFLGVTLADKIGDITTHYNELQAEIDARLAANSAITAAVAAIDAGLVDAVALVNTEVSQRVSGDSALVSQVNSIAALNASNTAAIISEQTARVTADSAMALDITALEASSDDYIAAVASEALARSNADGALASDITALETASSTAAATVLDIKQAKIGYAALASDSVTPYSGDGTTVVYSVASYPTVTYPEYAVNRTRIIDKLGVTLWNATGAGAAKPLVWLMGLPLATAVQKVGVSGPGGEYTSVEQAFTSQKTLNDGLKSQYTVKIDLNGHVSGFGLASEVVDGEPFSDFQIRADRFSITDPSGIQRTITSLTRSGTTATMTTSTAHGAVVGATFSIRGVTNDTEWNRTFTALTVPSSTQITFTVATTLTSPASGSAMKAIASTVPFVVSGGFVYIREAAIEKLTFTKLRDEAGTFVVQDGLVKAEKINTKGLSIKSLDGTTILSAGADAASSSMAATLTVGGVTLDTMKSNASSAKQATDDMSNDNVLTPVEKPRLIELHAEVSNEFAHIIALGNSYGLTSRVTDYTNSLNALAAYLDTLTTPVSWSNLTGNTTINGAAFRTCVANYYAHRQWLLDDAQTSAKTSINSMSGELGTKLDNDAKNVLTGDAALAVGSLTWNSTTGARTGGYGIGLSRHGIAAYNSLGQATLVIDGTGGNATFGGTLTANAINAVSTINIGPDQVTVPRTATKLTVSTGGASGYAEVMTYTFTMPSAGKVVVLWNAVGGYSGTTWVSSRIKINGTVGGESFAGDSRLDSPTIIAFGDVVAGSNTVTVEIDGDEYQANTQRLVVMGAQR